MPALQNSFRVGAIWAPVPKVAEYRNPGLLYVSPSRYLDSTSCFFGLTCVMRCYCTIFAVYEFGGRFLKEVVREGYTPVLCSFTHAREETIRRTSRLLRTVDRIISEFGAPGKFNTVTGFLILASRKVVLMMCAPLANAASRPCVSPVRPCSIRHPREHVLYALGDVFRNLL